MLDVPIAPIEHYKDSISTFPIHSTSGGHNRGHQTPSSPVWHLGLPYQCWHEPYGNGNNMDGSKFSIVYINLFLYMFVRTLLWLLPPQPYKCATAHIHCTFKSRNMKSSIIYTYRLKDDCALKVLVTKEKRPYTQLMTTQMITTIFKLDSIFLF